MNILTKIIKNTNPCKTRIVALKNRCMIRLCNNYNIVNVGFCTQSKNLIVELRQCGKLEPKYIKDMNLNDVLLMIESPLEKEFFNSDMTNAIQLKLLKDIQVNQAQIKMADILTILKFFVTRNYGSLNLYKQLEESIKQEIQHGIANTDDLSTWIKIIGYMIKSNKFNKLTYSLFQQEFLNYLEKKAPFIPYERSLISQIAYNLSLVHVTSPILVTKLIELMSENYQELDREALINCLWSFFLDYPMHNNPKTEWNVLKRYKYPVEVICTHLENITNEKKGWLLTPSTKLQLRQVAPLANTLYSTIESPKFSKLSKIPLNLNKTTSEISLIHDDVTAVLRTMKNWTVNREQLIDIYMIDLLIDSKIIIEVNGPSHFIGIEDLDNEENMNGKSLMKMKILSECFKYKYINIGYKQWYKLKGLNAKMEFLANKIYGNDEASVRLGTETI